MKDSVVRVGIHGLGRIGRTFLRAAMQERSFEVVVAADLHPFQTMAHLVKYDSVHGIWDDMELREDSWISAQGSKMDYFKKENPDQIPNWNQWNVDVVVECTGSFLSLDKLKQHMESGARRVLLSAPAEDAHVPMVVLGVTNENWQQNNIISCASCTTNSAAHMIQLIDELCGIESSYITTVHSYTGDQRLQDAPHKDLRRSRGALQSIVPTTTGAAKALTRVFPHLADKMGGCGMRVPVPDGSLTDITSIVKKPLSIVEINAAFKEAASNRWSGIVEYTDDPIVSCDVLDNPHSCLFDAGMTSVIGNMVKVVGWYDNEVGYSNRLCDIIENWK
ncbi:MAG: type glyceraldehyde-3-phosphate dehydrogenase [Bacteroidota bacterium]|jgi:glyceraldehyde 3-phosphate dehydrogenase